MLKPGNVALARLLLIVYEAGPNGISTYKLLQQLHSTHYGQFMIKRAEQLKLIKRVEGEEPGPGQFKPMYNIVTDKGGQLVKSQMRIINPRTEH